MLIMYLPFGFIYTLQTNPPTELPNVIVVVIGLVAPAVIQFIKRIFTQRWQRLLASVVVSGLTGVAAFYIVNPATMDLADTIAWTYAAAALAYSAFWKPAWEKFGSK